MGSKGGYRVAKPPAQITLAEMIDAIEGPFKLAVCCSGEPQTAQYSCGIQDNCQIKEPVRRVHGSLRQFLSQVSLADIAFHDAPIMLGLPQRESAEPRSGACVSESKARGAPVAVVHGELRSAT